MAFAPQEIRTFFVTSVTAKRRRLSQVDRNAELLVDVLQDQRTKGRLQLHAFVAMPDHMHLILTPAYEVSLEKAMQFVKGGFSFRLKSKSEVWQKSFVEHRIRDAVDMQRHIDYIEQNPVRAGLVGSAADFVYSSARNRNGVDVTPSHLQ